MLTSGHMQGTQCEPKIIPKQYHCRLAQNREGFKRGFVDNAATQVEAHPPGSHNKQSIIDCDSFTTAAATTFLL